MDTTNTPRRPRRNQGSKWIRPERRLGIYLRDGLCCVYCGLGVETEGVALSLDHVHPYSHGGTNESSNLVTACRTCNSSRGNRSVAEWSKAVATYRNGATGTAAEIVARVRRMVARKVRMNEARELIASR